MLMATGEVVRSPKPRGGPWQMTTSVSGGIISNFEARNASPWRLGALNAQC